jgi:hypothetical protein
MLRALCLTMTIFVVSQEYATADAPPDLGANAALKYWQAFAQLPKFSDAEQTKLTSESLTMPLDTRAKEIVTKAEYALKMLHYGAALPRCEWAFGWEEDGIEVLLPNLSAARVLSSLACLRARMRFEEGQSGEAIEDIVDALIMGRHSSLGGSLIAVLVGYHIEARMGDTLALYLPRLNADAIKKLKTRLDALPLGGSPAVGVLECEEKTLEWFVRKVKEAKDTESLLARLEFVGLGPEGKVHDPQAQVRAFLKECGGTVDGILKFAAKTRPCYALMAQKLELPLDQFEKEFKREAEKQAGNPVYKVFFPALANVRRAQARADVRRALLSAAIAVQLDGRDALKNHPDPVAGGPFEYVAFEGGFELRSNSKLMGRNDKPVVLIVGRRG